MSHWVSGIGYQVMLLTLKSPDPDRMEYARMCEKQDESWDPFSVPSPDLSFAGASEEIASELAPMEVTSPATWPDWQADVST